MCVFRMCEKKRLLVFIDSINYKHVFVTVVYRFDKHQQVFHRSLSIR